MNLKQYLSQTEPAYYPRVDLMPDEYIQAHTIKLADGTKLTRVYIHAFPGVEYVQKNNMSTLMTTDHDGNPKGYSVFRINL